MYQTRFKFSPGKLKSRWIGPYFVLKAYPSGYVDLMTERGPFKVNGHRLKLYHKDDPDRNGHGTIATRPWLDQPLTVARSAIEPWLDQPSGRSTISHKAMARSAITPWLDQPSCQPSGHGSISHQAVARSAIRPWLDQPSGRGSISHRASHQTVARSAIVPAIRPWLDQPSGRGTTSHKAKA
ncbi:hypothetical protein OSB04_023926 [Centaurea solstitialis]|uniref:Uncharacterized protein n=1 Tax=Centaurea solstitialis TaxID=347529 RepID=A0AA38WBK3_9ASTR|nr:hypothetical protein OSB04_023926 [Centaurea solstitialis]